MTLLELKEIIDKTLQYSKYAGECEVVVPIHPDSGIGGTKCVNIRYASKGFDWDNGKFILTTETKLQKVKL